MKIDVKVPVDEEGFILLECPHCKESFKIQKNFIEEEGWEDVGCPFCGSTDGNFLPDEVMELANAKMMNEVNEMIYREFKKIENKTKNSLIKITTQEPKKIAEKEVKNKVDNMEIVDLDCCNRKMKTNILVKFSGYYCPYCREYHG